MIVVVPVVVVVVLVIVLAVVLVIGLVVLLVIVIAMSLEQLQTLYGCLRAEYLQRVDSWAAAFRASLECREVAVVIPDPVRPVDPASTWLASPAGKEVIKELRWSVPDKRTAISRLRLACHFQGNRPSDARILHYLSAEGVPLRAGSTEVHRDSGGLTWHLAKVLLLHLCACVAAGEHPRPPIQCCSSCRGALFADIAAAAPLPCPWQAHL